MSPSAEWTEKARRNARQGDMRSARVFAIFAGNSAHAEGIPSSECPFDGENEKMLANKWRFGFEVSARAERTRQAKESPWWLRW